MSRPGSIEPKADAGHSALMDRVYRRQRHIYDLSRKYYLLGRDRMLRGLKPKPGENIVEIGCGTARNLIKLAKDYPGVKLYGLDASAEMLRTAGQAIAKSGFSDRIVLRQGLAEFLTPEMFGLDRPFDQTFFSYSLSMIPDWRGALGAAAANTATQGKIHIVDFGDLAGLWPLAGKALRAWLKLFHVAPREVLLKELELLLGSNGLELLPGRYAFVVSASPVRLAGLIHPSKEHSRAKS